MILQYSDGSDVRTVVAQRIQDGARLDQALLFEGVAPRLQILHR